MLAVVGRDRERLLHETIGFVSISVWAVVRLAVIALHTIAVRILVVVASSTLAFHLAIC